ncbi:MAG: SPOR domain-containing protein [Coxiellaceae bacterium]|nr:SPOR domain-containing protein [Coxiellaceae bacterium]
MIKDYSKLKQQQSVAKKPTRWLPLSLLGIAALALLTSLTMQVHSHLRHQQTKQQTTTPPLAAATPVVAKATEVKAKEITKVKPITTEFEFYQLLSKKTEPHPTNSATTTKSPAANTAPGNHYQLQTASLQNRLDAQRFARQLLAFGFKSDIQPFLHPDGTTWYRVIIGPIDNYANAKQTQAMLQAQHIDSLLSRTS